MTYIAVGDGRTVTELTSGGSGFEARVLLLRTRARAWSGPAMRKCAEGMSPP